MKMIISAVIYLLLRAGGELCSALFVLGNQKKKSINQIIYLALMITEDEDL